MPQIIEIVSGTTPGAVGETGLGIVEQEVGFTLEGGTLAKTLTVLGDATITATPYVPGGNDVLVSDGGTGVSTLLDHGLLIGSGADAITPLSVLTSGELLIGVTGNDPHALAAGATTKILVGGGANDPVWTEATGSGAPVRATSPTLVTPLLGTPTSGNLANCTGVPLSSQATAENDVLVGAPTPFGNWVKKTIAEFKTILGLGTAAYTATTAYDVAGAATGIIASSISDNDTTHCPDGNSIFGALNGKASTNQKLDDFGTPDDNTDLNANTTNHGLLLKATAPASGLTNVVAIENGETGYKNKALFDATSPETQAFGDSAAVGSAVVAARRDHKHAMMAAPTSVSGNAGTVTNATLTTAITVDTGSVAIHGNAANTSALTLGAGASSVSGSNTGDSATPAETTTTIGALINGATAKTAPVDADYLALMDSEATNVMKKLSWAYVKSVLKTYFDGLYGASGASPLHSAATAENDFLVGAPTPFGSWVKKTVAEVKTILGLGSAAYTASTAYDTAGAAAGIIAASISDGDTTHAPDGNSVFDALALKMPIVAAISDTTLSGVPKIFTIYDGATPYYVKAYPTKV